MKPNISTKTGHVDNFNNDLPNILKLLRLFLTNYSHTELDVSDLEISNEDDEILDDLISRFGELQLIKIISESAILKHALINK